MIVFYYCMLEETLQYNSIRINHNQKMKACRFWRYSLRKNSIILYVKTEYPHFYLIQKLIKWMIKYKQWLNWKSIVDFMVKNNTHASQVPYSSPPAPSAPELPEAKKSTIHNQTQYSRMNDSKVDSGQEPPLLWSFQALTLWDCRWNEESEKWYISESIASIVHSHYICFHIIFVPDSGSRVPGSI